MMNLRGRVGVAFWASLAGALWPAVTAAAGPRPPAYDQKAAERYIIESEGQWALSVATGRTADVERILADDYRGVGPDGNLAGKAEMIAGTPASAAEFISNRLNAVTVRFYGDTAVAQGSETWERRHGPMTRGRFVWTDTWIRRDGRWRIVASEDLVAPEAAP